MAINDRIKEARNKKGLTQEQLGNMIGVAKSTVAGYERGSSEPNIEIIIKIMRVLDVDANYLWQDYGKKEELSPEDMQLLKNFRSLDQQGKDVVIFILNSEKERCRQISELEGKISKKSIQKRTFAYYGKIAAAGQSFGFDDIASGTLELPVTDKSENADYVVGVSGDSMKPVFYDGDLVYVQKATHLDIGEVGIFQFENGIYIKEVGENALLSYNHKYPPLVSNSQVYCLGRVIGKVEE